MAVPPPHHKKSKRKVRIIKFLLIRTLGNFLILLSLFGVVFTFGPALSFEVQYQLAKTFNISYKIAEVSQESELGKLLGEMRRNNSQASESLFASIISGHKEKILIPESSEFSVVIPKIGANENVIPNIDPNNEEEYLNALTRGIAHAKGTAFPGLLGTTYLFAHSADNFWDAGRYNAVFYLLNKMESGDEISLFYNDRRYDYKVTETKIVEASDTHYISSKIGQGEKLILQTCWPPGTAWKRLLIFADLKT